MYRSFFPDIPHTLTLLQYDFPRIIAANSTPTHLIENTLMTKFSKSRFSCHSERAFVASEESRRKLWEILTCTAPNARFAKQIGCKCRRQKNAGSSHEARQTCDLLKFKYKCNILRASWHQVNVICVLSVLFKLLVRQTNIVFSDYGSAGLRGGKVIEFRDL